MHITDLTINRKGIPKKLLTFSVNFPLILLFLDEIGGHLDEGNLMLSLWSFIGKEMGNQLNPTSIGTMTRSLLILVKASSCIISMVCKIIHLALNYGPIYQECLQAFETFVNCMVSYDTDMWSHLMFGCIFELC